MAQTNNAIIQIRLPAKLKDAVKYTVPANSPANQLLLLMGNDTPGGLGDNIGSIVVEITVQSP